SDDGKPTSSEATTDDASTAADVRSDDTAANDGSGGSNDSSDTDEPPTTSAAAAATTTTEDANDTSTLNDRDEDTNRGAPDPADNGDSASTASDDPNGDATEIDADGDLNDPAAQNEAMSDASSDENMSTDPEATDEDLDEELSPFGFVPVAESPGTVRLELDVEEGAFCDLTDCGLGRRHIVIFAEEAGAVLVGVGRSDCPTTPCDTCEPSACPGFACSEPEAYELADEAFVWDGSFIERSSCGDGSACERSRYAPPGRYFAQMCATPGTVSDGMCVPTAGECVSFEFDFPGDTRAAELVAP